MNLIQLKKRIMHVGLLALVALITSCTSSHDDGGYLFVYFTGNDISQEAICYAISSDGYTYQALNNNKPVIDSKVISSTGGVRDPYILRCEDGKTFYMVATDMVSANGWDSNRAMVLLKSTDLVHWSHAVVNIQQQYQNQEDLKRVWAPQIIFDPTNGKYMVYWSMKHGDGPDIIYYAYANKDFTNLEGEPKELFVPQDKKSCIDGDIICKDGTYYLFYKTEGHGNGIKVATTTQLTSGQWTESTDYKQQTKESVEGSCVFKLTNQNKYILMYDVYIKGKYQFTESTDLKNFKTIDKEVKMNFHPRHGTVMSITRAELNRITEKWGKPAKSDKLSVNPVLSGFHADPEILYSKQTGKYYMYSTTDGHKGWGGWSFSVFSSSDLHNWKNEGVILDLKSEQVSWANGNAWAPCIEEKLIQGKYTYFLYYSGNPVHGEGKQIGVAIADSPIGPFTDLGHSIVSKSPVGGGQQIDVDVFTDPVSGKSYLFWGNGYMAGAELNQDMTSINEKSITVMTPEGGTLQDYAYREAPYVFYRKGLYYFMWSVDDTGSANYHVAYGTSKSPLGPIQVAKNPVVLIQHPEKEIYGTGHNAVLHIPDTDKWVIVYHRINKNYLKDNPGIHREVCIDQMEFNQDGTIKPVHPAS